MGSLCDFCGGQRSMVYCKSDAASLCLQCDRNVHSANALSRRHSRALLCDRCYSQPATVRCTEEHISLCQDCDWKGHVNSTSSSGHKRQATRSYSGCPSATELARIWPFVLDFPPITDCSSEQGIMGLMSINENSTCTYWGPLQQSSTADMADICGMNDVEKVNTTNVQIASSTGTATPMTCSADQQANLIDSTTPKSSDDGRMRKVGNSEDDFYDGFAVDDELTFRNYEELFGASHEHSEDLFDDLGIDSIFEMENSAASSNYHVEFAAEASSASQVKSMQVESNNAISVDSVMPNQGEKTGCNISISARQAHSNISHTFSSLTGESSAGEYQDYGMPSMLLTGEPPRCPTSSDISIQATNRDNAVMRYKEKKKARKFEKRIRYASRKTRADSRRRVKGRFVKAGEAFDYDPLSQTRSY